MQKRAEEAAAYYNKKPEKMNTYEASEGVKGLTPKVTQESHKKCTPGEFNMNKEGARLRLGSPLEYGVATGGGAGLGAIIGALAAEKGKRLRGAGRGALYGAGAGAGAALGGALTHGATYDHILNHKPFVLGGNVLGGLVGAGAVDAALNPEQEEEKASSAQVDGIKPKVQTPKKKKMTPEEFGKHMRATL
jgi:hypothetical protein